MEEKIVFKGNSDKGKEMVIRYPTVEDLKKMWEYINEISKEKTFIRFQGEEVSLEGEEKFLSSELEKINKNQSVQLLVFHQDKLIGIAEIDMKDKIGRHQGVLGISILKDFRGEGIGSILMQCVLDEAKKNLSELEIVVLGVFANNSLAIEMYQKFGFVEYGKLPKGIKLEEGYVDHIYMYKVVKG